MPYAPRSRYIASGKIAWRLGAWRHRLASALAVASLWWIPLHDAHAVLTNVLVGNAPRSITLQVGSPGGTIDNVVFNVTDANVSPSPTPVTQPATVGFRITANRVTNVGTNVTLTADSSTGLTCVAGSGCGTTVMPFSKISWTSDSPAGTTGDIQSGSFNGSATQTLASYPNNVRICPTFAFICVLFPATFDDYDTNLLNNLRFIYANDQLYPAGQYRGRVRFTATMP